jgi:hypothetical protein
MMPAPEEIQNNRLVVCSGCMLQYRMGSGPNEAMITGLSELRHLELLISIPGSGFRSWGVSRV